jgi:hypothetical protein
MDVENMLRKLGQMTHPIILATWEMEIGRAAVLG